jgi:hypothetical protein
MHAKWVLPKIKLKERGSLELFEKARNKVATLNANF